MTRAIDVVTLTGAEYDALVDERDDLQEKLVEALRWKAAVDDAGVVHWTLTEETANDPRKAIGALLDTVSNIALDPAVSRDAAKLRDTYLHRAEIAERELAERTQERDGVAANLANTQMMFEDWKVIHSTVALEVALVRERERREAAERDAELLWANCRIIYFPDPSGSYPLEHNMRACGTKDSRADIEAALRIDAAHKERT